MRVFLSCVYKLMSQDSRDKFGVKTQISIGVGGGGGGQGEEGGEKERKERKRERIC